MSLKPKKPLVKVRKPGKQPPTAAVPVLPSDRALRMYQLALENHAREQQAVQEQRAAEKK